MLLILLLKAMLRLKMAANRRYSMKDKIDSILANLPISEQGLLVEELHKIAQRYMHKESAHHTLQATALVNEAYVNLSGKTLELEDKQHFIAIAARQMRRILVDHARKKLSDKRRHQSSNLSFAELESNELCPLALIEIDRMLDSLSALDERAAKVYELRLFSGLVNAEIADLLDISLATVERDAKAAKAWIKSELASED